MRLAETLRNEDGTPLTRKNSLSIPATETMPKLSELNPKIAPSEMTNFLVPPPQFANASFDNYRPDENYPSQNQVREYLRTFMQPKSSGGKIKLFGKKKSLPLEEKKPGVYLDGGFGVGKTHLLAALWHSAIGRKHYGTFIEYTSLVGALGYNQTLELLKGSRLICIDEFELDDPGDTMMMTRLLSALADGGTKIAATSNTPPNALGEGRFAAQDFLREIQSLSSRFTIMRVEGSDYRRRGLQEEAILYDEESFLRKISAAENSAGSYHTTWDDLLLHLAKIHPARYVRLAANIKELFISDVRQLHDQTEALRLVAFVDRLYDAQTPIVNTGIVLNQVFDDEMLAGGFQKKYQRAISRMVALSNQERV